MNITYLVKKNPQMPGKEGNWIEMTCEEFNSFVKSAEGKDRAKYFAPLLKVVTEEDNIYFEADSIEEAKRMRAEQNHSNYLMECKYSCGMYEVGCVLDKDGECFDVITNLMSDTDVENEVEMRSETEALYSLLEEMEEAERELIRRLYLSDLPTCVKEYAEELGVSEWRIYKMRERVLAKLREQMKEWK